MCNLGLGRRGVGPIEIPATTIQKVRGFSLSRQFKGSSACAIRPSSRKQRGREPAFEGVDTALHLARGLPAPLDVSESTA